METKMTSSFDNSIIGNAEYDGFVSSTTQEEFWSGGTSDRIHFYKQLYCEEENAGLISAHNEAMWYGQKVKYTPSTASITLVSPVSSHQFHPAKSACCP